MKNKEKAKIRFKKAGFPAPAAEKPEAIPQTDGAENNIESYEIIGVRFKPVGKTYYFDPNGKTLALGDSVVVETSRGVELGQVSVANKTVTSREVVPPLKKMLRIATEEDLAHHREAKELEERARKVWYQKIEGSGLAMALSDVDCTFDRSKLVFYFTAEGRVDFREFVKELASVFKMRIELRQIGVRDEAKQLGGLGICGRPLCCNTFLEDFQQVSIKMAKEQNLSLNSAKISGTCGRLMCCLRYENDTYSKAAKLCPKQDQYVQTPDGNGTVLETNVLAEKCRVRLDGDTAVISTYPAQELKVLPKPKKEEPKSKQ